ncbi:hypothetical protein AQ611_12445 [Burkholderia singularis]|nr:hypothetical protein AQ611_12445 [Burkholderia sp. Bp7605]
MRQAACRGHTGHGKCVITDVMARSITMNDSTRSSPPRSDANAPFDQRQTEPPPSNERGVTRARHRTHQPRHPERRPVPPRDGAGAAGNPPAATRATRIDPDTPPGTHDEGPWQDSRERRGPPR